MLSSISSGTGDDDGESDSRRNPDCNSTGAAALSTDASGTGDVAGESDSICKSAGGAAGSVELPGDTKGGADETASTCTPDFVAAGLSFLSCIACDAADVDGESDSI